MHAAPPVSHPCTPSRPVSVGRDRGTRNAKTWHSDAEDDAAAPSACARLEPYHLLGAGRAFAQVGNPQGALCATRAARSDHVNCVLLKFEKTLLDNWLRFSQLCTKAAVTSCLATHGKIGISRRFDRRVCDDFGPAKL